MTRLQRRALARLPLTADEVEALYAGMTPHPAAVLLAQARDLCESHERLRAERDGAAAMLALLVAGAGQVVHVPAAEGAFLRPDRGLGDEDLDAGSTVGRVTTGSASRVRTRRSMG